MDINGWLTVITVFMAVFTLLPKEDLFLRFQRTSKILRVLFLVINVVIVPYLLFFDKLILRFRFFGYFTVSWGFDPENIAFALFYISFIWLLFRLFLIKSKPKADRVSIDFFTQVLNEKPFEEFFGLFTKYTPDKYISDDWENYKRLLFRPKFLNEILESRPSYLLQFWEKFNSENDFQSIFRLFLENPNSVYYSEIKEHWNSYSLLDDKPFLNTILKENIQQSIHNGILMVFSDHVLQHLQSEHGKKGIYNQEHYHTRLKEEEGFDLPMYFHIRFIGLMYSSAIENKIDISTISHRYTNMQTIYSSIVKQMVNNILVIAENSKKEYPSNYHWLISIIFDLQSNWLSLFSDEYYDMQRYFDESSSYISFIPFSMSLCLSELYRGLNNGKITLEFLNRQVYYNILSHYFRNDLNDLMKTSIEENIIEKIPKEHLKPILDYSLDEKFAKDYDDLIAENYGLANEKETEILQRLLRFLRRNDKI
jgi:hypothetical protein